MKIDMKSKLISFSKKETRAVLTYIIKELEKPNSSKLKYYRKYNTGICGNLKKELWKMYSLKLKKYFPTQRHFCAESSIGFCLCDSFSTWPNFSGNAKFPIGATFSKMPLWAQFNMLPHWRGEQLELRMDLLKHMKKELHNITIRIFI